MEGAAVAQYYPLPDDAYLRNEQHRLEEGFRAFQDSIADDRRQDQGTDCVCALAAGGNHHNNNSNNPELDSGDASNAGLRAALDRLTSLANAILAEQEGCPCAARAGGAAVTGTELVTATGSGTVNVTATGSGTGNVTGTDVGTLHLIGAPPGTENTQVENTQVEDTTIQDKQTGWTGPKGGDNNLFETSFGNVEAQAQSPGTTNPNDTMDFSTSDFDITDGQDKQTGSWTVPKGGKNNLFESLSSSMGEQFQSSGISNPNNTMELSTPVRTDGQVKQTGSWTVPKGGKNNLFEFPF